MHGFGSIDINNYKVRGMVLHKWFETAYQEKAKISLDITSRNNPAVLLWYAIKSISGKEVGCGYRRGRDLLGKGGGFQEKIVQAFNPNQIDYQRRGPQ